MALELFSLSALQYFSSKTSHASAIGISHCSPLLFFFCIVLADKHSLNRGFPKMEVANNCRLWICLILGCFSFGLLKSLTDSVITSSHFPILKYPLSWNWRFETPVFLYLVTCFSCLWFDLIFQNYCWVRPQMSVRERCEGWICLITYLTLDLEHIL